MANILYEVPVEPTVVPWATYIWLEVKDWWRVMLEPANPDLPPYPLSFVGKTLSWLTFLTIVLGGWMLVKNYKRKGRKHG